MTFSARLVAQDTGGKKLEVSEKSQPAKIDNKKVRNSKKTKVKGNPNKSSNRVIVINPFKWDWDKVMPLKAKKSDYATKEYNPNKRPKRRLYNNDQEVRSQQTKPGERAVELKKPLIPYDSRVSEKGPTLMKKKKAERTDLSNAGPQVQLKSISLNDPEETLNRKRKKDRKTEVDGANLYSKAKSTDKKAFDNGKLETSNVTAINPYVNDQKLMTTNAADKKPKPMDDQKLMTFSGSDKKPKPIDDQKLMTFSVSDKERKPFDDSKLMTSTVKDQKRKPFDDDKLMVSSIKKPTKQSLDDDRLYINVPKIERSKLHGEQLLTVAEKQYPTATMKRISNDIKNHEGDYVKYIKVSSDSHPTTKILASQNKSVSVIDRTFQAFSAFWAKIWKNSFQPKHVREKLPKQKRDKKEGKIWDNSVHPSEWQKEQAESGTEQ